MRKVLCLVASFALFLPVLFPMQPAFAAGESDDTSRAIAIAYDNSGSMETNSDKWCTAKYSLEVVAAMLNPADAMQVYTMDSYGCKLEVSGATDATSRVQAVHNADLGESDWTEPHAAQEAHDALLGSSADEKYLVITTDGKFNTGAGLSDVQAVVSDCQANGITVIYLAIGNDAEAIDSNPDGGVYVKLASSETILSTMTEMANQIFGRDALPATALRADGTLAFDVPMSKVIVFAQGENVRVGELSLADGSVLTSEQASVKYSEQPTASPRYTPFDVNTSLQGVVATFSGEMPKGACQLDIEGAESVEVYYTPYVDIAVGLTDDAGVSYELQSGEQNELSAGTYNASYTFLDPFTGEALNSDLLYPATFSVKLESNGQVQSVGEGEQITVSTGEATIIANAQTTGGVKVSQSYEGITVNPALVSLTVDASSVPDSFDVTSLEEGAYEVKVSKADGGEFSAEEWEAFELTVFDSSGISWDVQKSSTPGTATVRPRYVNGSQWDTQITVFGAAGVSAKQADVTFTAALDAADNTYRGQASKTITYGPDVLSTFLHALPWLLLLLVLLFLLYKLITKPRLPRKMKPRLEFGDEKVLLRYSERSISNRWSPFGPERVSVALRPRDASLESFYDFPGCFRLGSVGLVAAKKEKGKRRFTFDDATLRTMKAHRDNPDPFPDPEYSVALPESAPIDSSDDVDSGKSAKKHRRKRAKKRKQTPMSAGRVISFFGFKKEKPGERRRELEYLLKFK